MFTIGTLSLDVCATLEPMSEFVVLPFRVVSQDTVPPAVTIPYPPEFDRTQLYEHVGNCEIVGQVQSQGRTYYFIKSDHAKEFSEASRASLQSSITTISQHAGKVFSTCLLFTDQPTYRGVNRLFFYSLIAALRDRDRCVVIAEKEASAVIRVVQAVVGELSLSSGNGRKGKGMSVGLPPPPLGIPPSYQQDAYKRPREDCPSPTSQDNIRSFLKCPKVHSPVVAGNSRKNQVTLQEEDIMCVVCFDITPDVLTSECCGGLVCKTCISGIVACPACRQPTSFIENPMVTRIVNNIRVTCECGQAMSWSDLKAHKETCNSQLTCPAEGCRGLVMNVEGMKDHVRNVHGREVMKWILRKGPM